MMINTFYVSLLSKLNIYNTFIVNNNNNNNHSTVFKRIIYREMHEIFFNELCTTS